MNEEVKTTEKVKILILEPDLDKRQQLEIELRAQTFLNIVGSSDSLSMTLFYTKLLSPDIVIINFSNLGAKGIDAVCKIKEIKNDVKIIVISSGEHKSEIIATLGIGINAYCLNETSINLLTTIVCSVANNNYWFAPAVVDIMMGYLPKSNLMNIVNEYQLLVPLSEREMEVLKLLVQGKNNPEIARDLIISIHTAKAHVASILHKMNVPDRIQAVIKAINYKLVESA